MFEKGMENERKMLQKGAKMGAEIENKSIKMKVKKNIEISSKKVTPAYPAFGALSNLLLEGNLQKNNNEQQKTAKGGTSEREPPQTNSNTPRCLRPGADFWVRAAHRAGSV